MCKLLGSLTIYYSLLTLRHRSKIASKNMRRSATGVKSTSKGTHTGQSTRRCSTLLGKLRITNTTAENGMICVIDGQQRECKYDNQSISLLTISVQANNGTSQNILSAREACLSGLVELPHLLIPPRVASFPPGHVIFPCVALIPPASH